VARLGHSGRPDRREATSSSARNEATIDSVGRIVVPKLLRDALGDVPLAPSDAAPLIALAAVEHGAILATRDARARSTYETVGAQVIVAG
jgi:predicted nucleic acid-binding protein